MVSSHIDHNDVGPRHLYLSSLNADKPALEWCRHTSTNRMALGDVQLVAEAVLLWCGSTIPNSSAKIDGDWHCSYCFNLGISNTTSDGFIFSCLSLRQGKRSHTHKKETSSSFLDPPTATSTPSFSFFDSSCKHGSIVQPRRTTTSQQSVQ